MDQLEVFFRFVYVVCIKLSARQHGGIHTTKGNTHARVKTEVYILSGSYKRLKTYRYQGRSMSRKKIKVSTICFGF